jgi:hypothetical protein
MMVGDPVYQGAVQLRGRLLLALGRWLGHGLGRGLDRLCAPACANRAALERTSQAAAGNGIFAAGDRRPKRA